ncbi:UNVERIFIED_CONTAM: hypothetical protein NCL1_41282 [Trichonephila clavipes]
MRFLTRKIYLLSYELVWIHPQILQFLQYNQVLSRESNYFKHFLPSGMLNHIGRSTWRATTKRLPIPVVYNY